MLRFSDIVQGRYSAFEPKFSHFFITLLAFVATVYVAAEYRYQLPWYAALLLVLAVAVTAVGLVISFSSLRHSGMIYVQSLLLSYLVARLAGDWMAMLITGVVTYIVVSFFTRKVCSRYLKLRNLWETTTGILALSVVYPYAVRTVGLLIF